MQRIAYVANSLIPSRRASTAHVLNMSAGFAEAGAAVTLVARGQPGTEAHVFEDFGLPAVFDMRLQPAKAVWALDRMLFVRAIRSALRQGVDFVYGRSCYGLLGGVPKQIPFAYDLHALPVLARHRRLETMLFQRPNFLFATAISKALADAYVEAYPQLAERIIVAPCAAKRPDRNPDWSRPRTPGPLRVYYVGHLYVGRGIDLIVELARAEPEIEFHIVGGEDNDVAFWKERASANLHFHGYVKPASLGMHYEQADICIAPYGTNVAVAGGGDTSVGMSPMKIFEYMSYGKPIISSDLPVLREVIHDGVEGLLCGPSDIAGWRAALRSLTDNPIRRKQIGQGAWARFEKDFTWSQRARRILVAADRLIAAKA